MDIFLLGLVDILRKKKSKINWVSGVEMHYSTAIRILQLEKITQVLSYKNILEFCSSIFLRLGCINFIE